MAKSKIVITAGLSIPQTVSTIKKDLKEIQERLSESQTLKIQCNIDTSSQAVQAMQSQLNEISQKLYLKIDNINIGDINFSDIKKKLDSEIGNSKIDSSLSVDFDTKDAEQKLNQVENIVKYILDKSQKRISQGLYPKLEMSGDTETILRAAKESLNAVFNEWGNGDIAERVRRASESATGELSSFTVQVKKQSGATEVLTYRLNEEAKAYEYLGKTIREADNSTSFRRKGVDVQKQIQSENIDKLVSQLQSANLYTSEFREIISSLRSELNTVEDTNGMNKFLDSFDVLKAKISSAKEEFRLVTNLENEVNRSFNSFSGIIGSDVLNQNTSDIVGIKDNIDSLIERYKLLQQTIKYVESPKSFDKAQQDANELQAELGKVVAQIQRLEELDSIDIFKQLKSTELEKISFGLRSAGILTADFVDKIHELQISLDSVDSKEAVEQYNNELKVFKASIDAAKAKSKYIEQQTKEAERLYDVEQKEKELQDALQHDYWQGRFADSVKSLTEENSVLKEMKQYYLDLDKAAKDFANTQKSIGTKINTSINQLNSQSNSTIFRNNSNNVLVEEQLRQINELRIQYHRFETELSTAATPESLVKIQNEISKLTPALTAITRESKKLQAELRKDDASKTLGNRIQKLTADMNAFAVANQKAISSTQQMSDGNTFADKWIYLTKEMAKGSELSATELKNLQQQFRIFGKEAEAAGLKGQSTIQKFLNGFKQMTTYISAQAVWGFVRREISSMIEEVRTLDAELVNLKKVTDETNETYNKFTKSAQSQAKQLHSTTATVVEQTSEWAKLGYSLAEAQKLSRSSMIYSKVGEVDSETSVSDLVTILKAFNKEANESIDVVDKLNILGNNFATDAASLGDGLRVSASSLAVAGNDLSQSLAMLTGGTEITQNASEMGAALRVISMRIRSMKGELEELGEETENIESVSKIQTQILNLTNNRVNIFKDNGEFKSTYQILKEISEIYNSLSDTSKASLTEILFGKNRANQGLAVINAFQSGQIEKAYNTALKSANSAQNEFDKMSEGIEAHINDFKQAFATLSQTVISSDEIKNVVDTGTTLIDIIDAIVNGLGKIPSLLLAISAVGAFNGVGIFGDINFSNLKENFKDTFSWLSDLRESFKTTFKETFGELSKYKIDLKGLSNVDISSLQEYVNLISEVTDVGEMGEASQAAMKQAMQGASATAMAQANNFNKLRIACLNGTVSEEAYTAATNNLAMAQRTATVTSTALRIALNLIGDVAIMLAISAIVKGIDSLIHAEEKATEKAKELRDEAIERANAYNQEQKAIDDSVKQYQELLASTSDLVSEKEKLINIQDAINSNIEDETQKVDLLNKSLAENIELVQKQQVENAKDFIRKNQGEYDIAKEAMEYQSSYLDIFGIDGKMKGVTEFKSNFSQSDINAFIAETTGNSLIRNSDYGRTNTYTYLTGTLEEQLDTLKQMEIIYKEQADYDVDKYNILVEQEKKLQEQIDSYNSIINDYEASAKLIENLDIPDDVRNAFNQILNDYTKAQVKLAELQSGESTNAEIQKQQELVHTLGNELMVAAGKYTGLRDIAIQQANVVETSVAETMTSLDALSLDAKENLDNAFKDALSNIDKIKSAMQTLADGEGLDWSTVQELVFDMDSNKVLDMFKEVDGKYKFVNESYESLIQLKDEIINQQLEIVRGEKAEQQAALNTAQANLKAAQAKLARSQSESDAKYYKGQIATIQSDIDNINGLISNSDLLIRHLNSQLGDTVDIAKAIEAQQKKIEEEQKVLQKQQKALNDELKKAQETADNYAKAMTQKVSDIIEGLEGEKEALSDEKDILDSQLDTLEEKKSAIEETISKYKEVVDLVKSETDSEIEALKERQKTEEEAVQARIDALKESKDQQEESNSLAEKQLELQQKLADLENARNKKVRTYTAEQGWHYATDKEAVANAEEAVREAQKSYDNAIDDKTYNEQMKALESEKEAVTQNYEAQIQAYEDYYEQWKAILDEQENDEKELLAEELVGVNWREDIKNRDTAILNKYKSNYKSYNNQLNSLVNNEIASLKKSIEAKQAEIDAKEEQIKSWQKYKSEVDKAINSVKGKYDDYLQYLDDIKLAENSNLEDREQALSDFASNYENMIDGLNEKQVSLDEVESEIDSLAEKLTALQNAGNVSINITSNISDISDEMADFIETYRDAVEAMRERLDEVLNEGLTGYGIVNSAWDAKLAKAANSLRGYSYGGVIDYTGGAVVHGKPNSSEVAFNSGQAKSLYDMVRSGDFATMVADRAYQGLSNAMRVFNGNTDNSSRVININGMVIKADNPAQFHDQFMREIGNYWQVKLTESRVK